MNRRTTFALFDELEKISEANRVDEARKNPSTNVRELESKLEPGDVLLTAPDRRRLSAVIRYGYKPASAAIQGTDYGHAALYVGDGKIIDARMGRSVEKSSLLRLARTNNIVAVRPNATPEEKAEAVAHAHEQIGKEFDLRRLVLGAGLGLTRGTRAGKGPEEAEKLICSALVANAYSRRKFSDSSRLTTRPDEILNSRIVKPVTILERFNKKES